MSQAEENAAIEVTDQYSLAESLEQQWNEQEVSEAVEAEEEAEETTDTSSDDDSEEVEESADEETDEEAEDLEESEDQEPDAEEGETLHYENVNELAEALDMSIEDFMENIKITRKIDGVEEEVTLAELRNGNQRDADYRRKTTELAESRKNFDGEVSQVKEKLVQDIQEASQIAATLDQQLLSEFQSIDWNTLEIEDREEWLVQRQKFGERQQQIEVIKAQAKEKLTEYQQQQEQQRKDAERKVREEHGAKLLEVIPEWNDVEVWKADDKAMRSFLSENYGISDSEIDSFYDHRLIKLARDAMKNKGKTAAIDTVKKKVKKLPRIVKPGAKPDKVVAQKRQKQEKRNAFIKKDRHSTEEIANYLLGE